MLPIERRRRGSFRSRREDIGCSLSENEDDWTRQLWFRSRRKLNTKVKQKLRFLNSNHIYNNFRSIVVSLTWSFGVLTDSDLFKIKSKVTDCLSLENAWRKSWGKKYIAGRANLYLMSALYIIHNHKSNFFNLNRFFVIFHFGNMQNNYYAPQYPMIESLLA